MSRPDVDPLPPLSGDDTGRPPGDVPPPEIRGYEVLGFVGKGGMGTVWRAEQKSTRREVALKVLNVTPASCEKARARFEREVEVAARLQHPHIVRVYDSGLYDNGYYYAMELIDGVPLGEYVRGAGLDRERIVELMVTVCRAVQHAHQRGVIHRDLKPANILITDDGQPHVVDFGLAKALAETEPDAAVTLGDGVVGTPAYMSPEQAGGGGTLVDTRSDVYALGVILYRLLLGDSPHDLSGSRDVILQRIAREEPRRPRRVAQNLDRELEAVLLKALTRDPEDRYSAAGELADDLKRYLQGEPLLARTPTVGYFLRKRLKKHRVPATIVGIATTVLLAGAVWAMLRIADERSAAVAARDDAQTEARKATAVTDFFTETMASIDPAETGGRPVTARDVLARASRMLETSFPDDPRLKARIAHNLARRYEALGDVEDAERHFTSAVALRRRHLGPRHAETLASLHGLANVRRRTKEKAPETEELFKTVLAGYKETLGPNARETLRCTNDLAKLLAANEKYAEADALQRAVLQTSRQRFGEDPDTLAFMRDRANTLWLANEHDAAESLYEETLQTSRRLLGDDHPTTLAAMNDLADARWHRGEREKALALYESLTEARQGALGAEHPQTLDSLAVLATAMAEMGRHGNAESLRRQELRLRERVSAEVLADALEPLDEIAKGLYRQRKYKEAEGIHRDLLGVSSRLLGKEHPLTIESTNNLGNDVYYQGHFQEAADLHRTTLASWRERLGEDHVKTLISELNLADAFLHLGKFHEAESHYRDVLDRIEGRDDERRSLKPRTVEGLLRVLEAEGRTREAERLRRREGVKAALPQGDSVTASTSEN